MSERRTTPWVARSKVRRRAWSCVLQPRPAEDLGRATPSRRRGGSILLLVLVVIVILALGANTYLHLMQTEHRAVRRHGRAAQALRLSESGVEYLKNFLAQTPTKIQTQGGLASNNTAMKALIANDQPSEFDRGRFTIVCPAQLNGVYNGVRFGLENESGKLNLHALLAEGADAEARNRLLTLPSMTPEIADAILDWLDADSAPRQYGAEQDYYAGLDPAYGMRNGPIGSLDELLMVRGMTPELLYGFDHNRNMFVDASEQQPRGVLLEIDNAEGLMNRGWSAYLTIASVEAMGGSAAAPLVDLNGGGLQAVYDALKKASLTDEQAKFIILYRQFGATGAQGQGQGAGGPDGERSGERPPNEREQQGGGAGGPGDAATVSAASITINFQQPGGTPLVSLLDLIGAQVTVTATPPGGAEGQDGSSGRSGSSGGGSGGGDPSSDDGNGGGGGGSSGGGQTPGEGGGETAPPQIVASPWQANANSYRDLLKLYDAATANAGPVAGRVNINCASRPVLQAIPQLPPAAIEQILARRELEPNPTIGAQRHSIWLLVDGIVPLETMKLIDRFVTSRGDAFSGQSVGYFDADSAPVRGEFILDRAASPPRLRHWRDLTNWGPGFSAQLLGAPAKDAR